MAFYFKTKKLDISAGHPLVVVMNTQDALEFGLNQGDKVHLCWKDICLYVSIDLSDSEVNKGEVGMFTEVWLNYDIPADDTISITMPDSPKSVEFIRKKMKGERLNYEELQTIMDDVANRRLSTIMMTYFAASSFNPGFNEDEVYYLTKAMAENGDILDFTDGDPNKKVVDKHSIGGIPAKGVTPIIVPIVSLFGLTVPNTSSRAITTPSGTSDMLEVVMPIVLPKEKILEVVRKEGACLVWGGGMDVAPADDILINIERPLSLESMDKYLVSIVAKKVAMKITHLLVDIPYGPGAKVHELETAQRVHRSFEELCSRFNIKVDAYIRESLDPDGYGVGPLLEMRDLLRIFERDPRRPAELEDIALDMAGRLLELSGAVKQGEGKKMARAKLESGEAAEKFWSIAFAQGATKSVKSEDLILGEFTHTYNAKQSGVLSHIGNREVVETARALGAPFIKEAGMYFEKLVGDSIDVNEPLVTLYATSSERLELGKEVFERLGDFIKY